METNADIKVVNPHRGRTNPLNRLPAYHTNKLQCLLEDDNLKGTAAFLEAPPEIYFHILVNRYCNESQPISEKAFLLVLEKYGAEVTPPLAASLLAAAVAREQPGLIAKVLKLPIEKLPPKKVVFKLFLDVLANQPYTLMRSFSPFLQKITTLPEKKVQQRFIAWANYLGCRNLLLEVMPVLKRGVVPELNSGSELATRALIAADSKVLDLNHERSKAAIAFAMSGPSPSAMRVLEEVLPKDMTSEKISAVVKKHIKPSSKAPAEVSDLWIFNPLRIQQEEKKIVKTPRLATPTPTDTPASTTAVDGRPVKGAVSPACQLAAAHRRKLEQTVSSASSVSISSPPGLGFGKGER